MIRKIFFITTLSLLAFYGCVSKSDDKSLLLYIDAEPRTMDPTLNSQSSVSIYLNHAFEGLTRKDKDNKLAPGTAEKWTVSDDGKIYTFYIRSNAKWSDGKPVKAQDFEYSWKRVVDPTTAAQYSYLMEIVKNGKDITASKKPIDTFGVKVINDNVFEVTLENPTPYFLELISATGCFYPLREDMISKDPKEWSKKAETYIGNGAYKMKERKIDEYIDFELNTNYWAKDEIVAKKIKFIFFGDNTAALAALKNGTLHFGTPPSGDIDTLRKEGLIVDSNGLGTYYLELNITNKALSNPKVRRALALAYDRYYIVKNVMKGAQVPAGAFVPFGMNDYKGDFRENGGNYIDTNPESYQKNIEEAKKLMTEAGYPDGKNFPVIEYTVTAGTQTLVAEAIQQMWKENLGIDIVIRQDEYAVTQGRFRTKSYEIAWTGWTGDNDPMTMLDLFVSYVDVPSGFSNKEYDNLIDLARKTPDNEKRMETFHKAEDILLASMPIIPIYYRNNSYMVDKNLKGYILDPSAKHRFHYAYIEKK